MRKVFASPSQVLGSVIYYDEHIQPRHVQTNGAVCHATSSSRHNISIVSTFSDARQESVRRKTFTLQAAKPSRNAELSMKSIKFPQSNKSWSIGLLDMFSPGQGDRLPQPCSHLVKASTTSLSLYLSVSSLSHLCGCAHIKRPRGNSIWGNFPGNRGNDLDV